MRCDACRGEKKLYIGSDLCWCTCCGVLANTPTTPAESLEEAMAARVNQSTTTNLLYDFQTNGNANTMNYIMNTTNTTAVPRPARTVEQLDNLRANPIWCEACRSLSFRFREAVTGSRQFYTEYITYNEDEGEELESPYLQVEFEEDYLDIGQSFLVCNICAGEKDIACEVEYV